jgi:hypothetical protein
LTVSKPMPVLAPVMSTMSLVAMFAMRYNVYYGQCFE